MISSQLKDGFEGMPAKQKRHIGTGVFVSTFGTNLIIQACNILQGVMIARMLGPVGRGEFAAVTLWPTLFGSFGVAGIYIAIGRIAAKTHDYPELVRSGAVFATITSAVSAAACYVAVPWLLPLSEVHLIGITRFFILVIPLQRLLMNLNSIDQGRGDFKQFNLIRSVMNPTYVVLLIVVWLLGMQEVRWCVIAMLLANMMPVVIWLFTSARRYSFVGKLHPLMDIFRQSIPFSLAGIFQVLYLHIDKALMLWLLGTHNLGLYTVALSASSVVGCVTVSAGMVAFTMAAQAEHGHGFERLAQTFRISAIMWICFGGILAMVMSWVLPLVYGHEFDAAVGSARLLIIGSAFAGLSDMLEQAVRGQGKAYIGLVGRFIGLVLLAGLAIPFSKLFGISGVCMAFIIGQLVCLIVIIVQTNKHYLVKKIKLYFPTMEDVILLLRNFWEITTKSFQNKPKI